MVFDAILLDVANLNSQVLGLCNQHGDGDVETIDNHQLLSHMQNHVQSSHGRDIQKQRG